MNNAEKKHIYLMYAIGTLVLLPLFIFVGPFMIQGILLDDRTTWLIQHSNDSYWLYAAAGLFLAIFFILTFLYVKYAKWFVPIGIISFLVFLALGTFSYKALGSESISWTETGSFKANHYTWEDVTEVVLVLERNEKNPKIVFYFEDGKDLTVIRDSGFISQLYQLNNVIKEYDIPYIVDRTNQF
ncbi:hypothetical protein [Sutcliffiella rhizosphaerae]|uniref:Uncharacterized protein n=1 Tax=Sutcliffiella rhizosphaerae TaxID=2880967 RepID=A0ABM8YPX4_9BACI|nr:hypothetical protein [Sutcliffiella rhizosphaerae]CAG9622050.1 hypothetical protein BACCIP111883_02841 [Sutcliffiella rhizosphaerae]